MFEERSSFHGFTQLTKNTSQRYDIVKAWRRKSCPKRDCALVQEQKGIFREIKRMICVAADVVSAWFAAMSRQKPCWA